jgi:hypothetical protein
MEWINFKNEKPTLFNEVLVTDGIAVGVARYSKFENKWIQASPLMEEYKCPIEYWMELPYPPKLII